MMKFYVGNWGNEEVIGLIIKRKSGQMVIFSWFFFFFRIYITRMIFYIFDVTLHLWDT